MVTTVFTQICLHPTFPGRDSILFTTLCPKTKIWISFGVFHLYFKYVILFYAVLEWTNVPKLSQRIQEIPLVNFEDEIIERNDLEILCRSIVRRVLKISARVLLPEEVEELLKMVEELRCFEFPQMDLCYKFDNRGVSILLRKCLWHYDNKNKHVLLSQDFSTNPLLIYEILAKLLPGSSPQSLSYRFPQTVIADIIQEEKITLEHNGEMPLRYIFDDYRTVENFIHVLQLCRIHNETSNKSRSRYVPISFKYECRKSANPSSSGSQKPKLHIMSSGRTKDEHYKTFRDLSGDAGHKASSDGFKHMEKSTDETFDSEEKVIEEIKQISSRVVNKGFIGIRSTHGSLFEILIAPKSQHDSSMPRKLANQTESSNMEIFEEKSRALEDALKMLGNVICQSFVRTSI